MSAGDVTLTDAEVAHLSRLFEHNHFTLMIGAVEDILAARTPTTTGDDFRDRVTALAEQYEADAAAEGYGGELWSTTAHALRSVLAASSAPVVSRPEAVIKAEALREAADEVEALRTFAHGNNPTSKAHVIGFGTARRVAARLLRDRAASLDSDAP